MSIHETAYDNQFVHSSYPLRAMPPLHGAIRFREAKAVMTEYLAQA